ncbi:MAG: hypothetical protein V4677_14750 [Bacteroidota bacterium]
MLQFLAPKFMKEFDKKLLLNYPFWYIAKIHYILYFTILMWLLSYGIGCILPINVSEYHPDDVCNIWVFVFAILGIILFCVWIYYLTIYNNEDHFGKYSMWDDVKFLGIFIIGINLIMSFSYPMQLRVKTRLANVFTDAELAQQYNAINLGNKYVTTDLEDFQFCGYDVHDVVDYQQLQKDSVYDNEGRSLKDLKKYNRFLKHSSDYNNYYDYSFIFPNRNYTDERSEYKNALLNDRQIEREYDLHKTDAAKLNAIKNYFATANKYHSPLYQERYTPKDYLDNYNHIDKACTSYFPEAYNLNHDDKNNGMKYLPDENMTYYMGNIYKAKFLWPTILTDGYLLFAFYFSFFVSLFVIIFRNNKWQHYLVSVVSFILLAIILGIISLGAGYPYNKYAYPTLAFLTWLAAAIISLIYYFKKDRYSVVGAVATNLFYICLPVVPLFVCVFSHEALGLLKCNYDYSSADAFDSAYFQLECDWKTRKYTELLRNIQLIGIGVFVFGVMPFYKVFFAKQKALPRDK